MVKTEKVDKLKKDISAVCNVAGEPIVNIGEDKTVLVRFIPKDEDAEHILSDHFEDMIIEALKLKGYNSENIPGIGFIVKDMD